MIIILKHYVAIVTPFYNNKKINYKEYNKLLEHLISNNVDGVIVCGTTGESNSLSYEEKLTLFRYTTMVVNKRIDVIANTVTNNTEESKKLTKEATEAGVDKILAITPYYNKTSEEGIFKHFEAISKSTDLDIILYNVPSRTNINLNLELLLKLQKIENIKFIKEASVENFKTYYKCKDLKLEVFCGDDFNNHYMLTNGAIGLISVLGNVYPEDVSFLVHNFNYQKDEFKKYNTINKLLFIEPNPIPLKYFLYKQGFLTNIYRLPLVEPNEIYKNLIDDNYKKIV